MSETSEIFEKIASRGKYMKLSHRRKGEREKGRKLHEEIIIQTFQVFQKTSIYRFERPNKFQIKKYIIFRYINQTAENERKREKLGINRK